MDLHIKTDNKPLICPICGKHIDKIDHYCYCHWDGGEWSDLRHEAPQAMVPALVQLCPHCGNHFALDADSVMVSDSNRINFIEPVELPAMLHGAMRYCMPMTSFKWDNPAQEYNQRLRFLWAYNDYFHRNETEHPEADGMMEMMHSHNIHELLKFYKNPFMRCDLMRQACDFEDCISYINSIIGSAPKQAIGVLQFIKQKAVEKDSAPFRTHEIESGNEC